MVLMCKLAQGVGKSRVRVGGKIVRVVRAGAANASLRLTRWVGKTVSISKVSAHSQLNTASALEIVDDLRRGQVWCHGLHHLNHITIYWAVHTLKPAVFAAAGRTDG